MSEKLGLVLEGGGAKGSYHLGVYKALHELGYHFDGVAGTSIGALNGALIAQGDWFKAYELWYNISNNQIYGVDEEVIESLTRGEITGKALEYAADVIHSFIKSKGIDTTVMKELFSSRLNEKKLRKSKTDLGIVTVKLPDFKTVEIFKDEIPKGEILSYLMASANFPLFKREEGNSGTFIDGGIINNMPLNMLPTRGIKEIIAVRTLGVGVTKRYKNPEVKITYIEPSKHLGGTLDFNRLTARENLQLGYQDTFKQLRGYVGKEFCIKPLTDDLGYIQEILNTRDEKILLAAKAMGYENVNPKRFMFERLLPQIAEYLDLGIDASYEEIILSFFEEIGKYLDINQAPIYHAEEFTTIVRDRFRKEHGSSSNFSKISKIVLSSSFLSSFVKNDFFNFIMDIFFK